MGWYFLTLIICKLNFQNFFRLVRDNILSVHGKLYHIEMFELEVKIM